MQYLKLQNIIYLAIVLFMVSGCAGPEKVVKKTGSPVPVVQGDEELKTKVLTGEIVPPKPIKSTMVQPKYPRSAKKAGVEGKVVINFVVTKDGIPVDIYVGQSLSEDCDKACIDAVKKWLFIPATEDGNPIAVYYQWTFSFDIKY